MAVYVSSRNRLKILTFVASSSSAALYLLISTIPSILKMINFTNIALAAFQMPKVGLGTLGISSSEASTVINEALSLGYRLIDCAPVYFNEKEIGDAFHESTSGVPRTDVFITSKLASPFHRPEVSFVWELRREKHEITPVILTFLNTSLFSMLSPRWEKP